MVIAALALILILIALFAYSVFRAWKNLPAGQNNANQALEFGNVSNPNRQLAEKSGRPTFGNPDARLVIVEFGDFYCPLCAQEFSIIRELMNRHQDGLKFIYRNFPTQGDNSVMAAAASLCANEQGKFWAMHDKLFLTVDKSFTADIVRHLAQQSGADLQQYDNCVKSKKYEAQILEDWQDALNLEVRGTPTFFVNGSKLEGVVKLADWEQIINLFGSL